MKNYEKFRKILKYYKESMKNNKSDAGVQELGSVVKSAYK